MQCLRTACSETLTGLPGHWLEQSCLAVVPKARKAPFFGHKERSRCKADSCGSAQTASSKDSDEVVDRPKSGNAKRAGTTLHCDWRRAGFGFPRPTSRHRIGRALSTCVVCTQLYGSTCRSRQPPGGSGAHAEHSEGDHESALRTRVDSTTFALSANAANHTRPLARESRDDSGSVARPTRLQCGVAHVAPASSLREPQEC